MSKDDFLEILVESGMDRASAEKQLESLERLAKEVFILRVLEENPNGKITNENIESYISEKYSKEQIESIYLKVSEEIFLGYLSSLAGTMDVERKRKFIEDLTALTT